MGHDRDRLVEENLDLVRSIAGKLRRSLGRTLDLDELVAYGSKGLVEAATRFDSRQGVAFSTFAYYRIRGAMLDGLRSMGWYSRGDLARYRAEERANEYLRNRAEREGAPAPPGRSDDAAATLAEIAEVLSGVATIHITSLEAAAGVTDERLPPPDQQLERLHLQARAHRALAKLPEKERRLLQLHYFEDMNLEVASAKMGLSKSWGSRLHARAVDQLRQVLEEEENSIEAE
ncbi:MAG: sigma-70 family RNA polymerase sigma factor [Polyangia bacterium]